MIYRGQAFSPSYDLLSIPPPQIPLALQEARPETHRKNEKERQHAARRGGKGGGAKSNDGEIAWSSIQYIIQYSLVDTFAGEKWQI
jgi:hypothetical protein